MQHQAMNRRHAAQHFVARQLQAHRHVATALRLAHRFHAAAHDFLLRVAPDHRPNTEEDDDDDQECERKYEQAHSDPLQRAAFHRAIEIKTCLHQNSACWKSNIEIGR